MFDRPNDILVHYEELVQELSNPSVAENQNRFRKLVKEQTDLTPLVETYTEYRKVKQVVGDSLALLEEESDEEMQEMLKKELSGARKHIEELEQELKILLLPRDLNDDRNIVLEIRAGAGGDEVTLLTSELYRMYCNYADNHHWKAELVDVDENGIGGFKEVVAMITGQKVYSKLEYEGGVHRVQCVPEAKSGGRTHTSTATVTVMSEAKDMSVVIKNKDCRIDVMRIPRNDSQCVNATNSTVRLTHIPTETVICSQTEKSQLQNKEKAFHLLRSKSYDMELEKRQNSEAGERRSQIGVGDRSEKIRTYSFPQGRIVDRRVNLTLYKLDKIMNSDIQEIIDACIAANQAAKLVKMNKM